MFLAEFGLTARAEQLSQVETELERLKCHDLKITANPSLTRASHVRALAYCSLYCIRTGKNSFSMGSRPNSVSTGSMRSERTDKTGECSGRGPATQSWRHLHKRACV